MFECLNVIQALMFECLTLVQALCLNVNFNTGLG